MLLRRPVVVDGQVLATEVQFLLAIKKLAGLPAAEALPLAEARVELRRQQLLAGGRQHVGALRDLVGRRRGGPAARPPLHARPRASVPSRPRR